MSEEKKQYGWWSEEVFQYHCRNIALESHYTIYETTNGKEVKVTHVTSTPNPPLKTTKIQFVGLLNKHIQSIKLSPEELYMNEVEKTTCTLVSQFELNLISLSEFEKKISEILSLIDDDDDPNKPD